MLFIVFSLVLSLFFQVKVFGDISVIWDSWSQETQKWQSKLDAANETMTLMKLGEDLREEIRDFIVLTKSTQELSKQQEKFLEQLSASRKHLVQSQFF